MRAKPAIQKLLAAFLLALSLIGSLPKSYFHDALANHTDGIECTEWEGQSACVHAESFHCAFTDLVVATPYVPATETFVIAAPFVYQTFCGTYTPFVLPNFFLSTQGRGPPVAVA